MNDYEIFDTSNFTMASGLEKPEDTLLMSLCESEDPSTSSMALWLVFGEEEMPSKENIDSSLLADVAVLHMLLSWSKATQCLDIQKIMDMPVIYLKRWQKSFSDAMAQGIIPKTDTPSAEDLTDQFNME
jgi:hypothetical protein